MYIYIYAFSTFSRIAYSYLSNSTVPKVISFVINNVNKHKSDNEFWYKYVCVGYRYTSRIIND